jgi:hypothetical protein
VRFRRIEVRSYRAIDLAEVELGPGLNVLYGPNDLGKSTLASAMRAALLLPSDSSAHLAFLPWHGAGPSRVRLTIEQDGTLYRVTKVFGSSSVGSSQLESSPDGSSYHEEERGRAVDRRLRELFRWGIEAPGGKGGSRGLPESFLSHVLLGSQSDVPLILDSSLEGDRDASGRDRLHEALQALSQDPVFKRVLAVAQAKVDAAFTPTGRRKTGQSSPLAPIKEQITQLVQEFERLTHQRRESEEVQARITSLGDERLRLEAERERLVARVARESELTRQLGARQEVLAKSMRAEQALAALTARRAELATLSAELGAQRASAAASAEHAALLAERQRAAEVDLASIEQAAGDASSPAVLEQLASTRSELERELQQRRAAHAEALRLVELERQVAAAQAACETQAAELAAAATREAAARQALTEADAELERLRELTQLLAWREAERVAERAQAAIGEADTLEQQANVLRARASAASTNVLPEVSPATLAALRALEGQIGVAAARLDVGLGLVLEVPPDREVHLSLDGAQARAVRAAGQPLRERARSRIVASIAGGVSFEVNAGDPALRDELEALQLRWGREAAPLLEAFGTPTLEALAERVEAERARRRELDACSKEAAALELRAAEKRELAGDPALARRRAEQRRLELSSADPSELEARLTTLVGAPPASTKNPRAGAAEAGGPEALIERRRVDTSKRRSSAEAALTAAAAARASAAARATALGEARDGLQNQLAQVWHARGAPGPLPVAAELARRLVELERAGADAARALTAHDERIAGRAAAAREARERAIRALALARQAHDAAQAAAREGRERELTLETRVKERSLHLDPAAEDRARAELEASRAELAAFGPLDDAAPERLEASRAELERTQAELERALAELRRAEGALGHVGGDVAIMREHQTHEALELARARELDQERDFDAYKLLLETLRAVENEEGAHLGRLLEVPVSERFERLTEGRYRQVGLDAGLGLAGIAVAGRPRAHAELSEGTREQLATILRLCIAEYLDTALVLDDHLAQTHRQRAEWFRSTLREAAARIQIVVLTARPEDYLEPSEMCDGVPCKDVSGAAVRAIDLERIIERARYGVATGG